MYRSLARFLSVDRFAAPKSPTFHTATRYDETTFWHRDSFKKAKPNSVGLINWLRQPGLLFNQPPKSMRVNINPLIKFYCTLTDLAAETTSIGLPADALVPCFLLVIWTVLSWPKTHTHHSDLVPSGQFHHDQQVRVHLPGLAKNAAPRHGRQLN